MSMKINEKAALKIQTTEFSIISNQNGDKHAIQ